MFNCYLGASPDEDCTREANCFSLLSVAVQTPQQQQNNKTTTTTKHLGEERINTGKSPSWRKTEAELRKEPEDRNWSRADLGGTGCWLAFHGSLGLASSPWLTQTMEEQGCHWLAGSLWLAPPVFSYNSGPPTSPGVAPLTSVPSQRNDPQSSFFLSFMCFANCILYLGYSRFLG